MAEMEATTGGKTISKREQKRQEKLARQQAEAAAATQSGGGAAPTGGVNADGSVLPIIDETTDNSAPVNDHSGASAEQGKTTEARKPIYIDPIQKRIRVLLKKKAKIDKLEELIRDPEEAKKLNDDQREILKRKDQVLAPLKELQQLTEQLQELEVEETRAVQASETTKAGQHAQAVADAKEHGREEGRQILTTLVAFLHHASVLRENPSTDAQLNEASERLLTLVYTAGETSVEAAERLAQESDELVDGTEVSYKQVAAALKPQEVATPAVENDQADAQDSLRSASDKPEGTTGLKGSNFFSIDDVLNNPTPIGHGGISFLNESEIDGVHAPEEPAIASTIDADVAAGGSGPAAGSILELDAGAAESATTTVTVNPPPAAATQPPAQTATTEPEKHAVNWQQAATTSNWADDDFDSPESANETAVTPAVPESPAAAAAVAGDDFKQVGGRRGGGGLGRGGAGGRSRGSGRSNNNNNNGTDGRRQQQGDRPPRQHNGTDGRQRSNRSDGQTNGDGGRRAGGGGEGRRNGPGGAGGSGSRRTGGDGQRSQRQPSSRPQQTAA